MNLGKSALCLAGILVTANAAADDWDWRVMPYVWTAGVNGDTQLGPITTDVDASFSDILDNLDFAVMLWVQADKPDYSIYSNLVYMSIGADTQTTPLGGTVGVKVESLISETGYFRQLGPKPEQGWELGLRYYSTKVSFSPTLIRSISDRQSWLDGYAGYRFVHHLNDKWSFVGRITLGAGGSDYSYSLAPMFYRQYESGNRLMLGLRTLAYDYQSDDFPLDYDLRFTGFIVGYSFD